MKRLFLLVLAVGLITTACENDDQATGDAKATGTGSLTLAAFGGTTQDNVNEIYLEPFTREKEIEALNDSVDYGKLYSMVDADNVIWDVVNTDGWFAERACEDGKAEPLTQVVIDAIEEAGLPDDFYGECHIAAWSYSWVLGYQADLPQSPDSWADFYDLEKFPGKRSMWSFDVIGIIESAAISAGADPNDLYPIDVEKALNELEKVKDEVIFTESLADQIQHLISDRASMGVVTSSRAVEAMEEEQPVAVRWEEQILAGDAYFVPAGSANADIAMEFLASLLGTDKLVRFAVANGYGPNGTVAQAAISEIPECDLINTCPKYLPASIRFSDEWWKENREMVDERFQELFGA